MRSNRVQLRTGLCAVLLAWSCAQWSGVVTGAEWTGPDGGYFDNSANWAGGVLPSRTEPMELYGPNGGTIVWPGYFGPTSSSALTVDGAEYSFQAFGSSQHLFVRYLTSIPPAFNSIRDGSLTIGGENHFEFTFHTFDPLIIGSDSRFAVRNDGVLGSVNFPSGEIIVGEETGNSDFVVSGPRSFANIRMIAVGAADVNATAVFSEFASVTTSEILITEPTANSYSAIDISSHARVNAEAVQIGGDTRLPTSGRMTIRDFGELRFSDLRLYNSVADRPTILHLSGEGALAYGSEFIGFGSVVINENCQLLIDNRSAFFGARNYGNAYPEGATVDVQLGGEIRIESGAVFSAGGLLRLNGGRLVQNGGTFVFQNSDFVSIVGGQFLSDTDMHLELNNVINVTQGGRFETAGKVNLTNSSLFASDPGSNIVLNGRLTSTWGNDNFGASVRVANGAQMTVAGDVEMNSGTVRHENLDILSGARLEVGGIMRVTSTTNQGGALFVKIEGENSCLSALAFDYAGLSSSALAIRDGGHLDVRTAATIRQGRLVMRDGTIFSDTFTTTSEASISIYGDYLGTIATQGTLAIGGEFDLSNVNTEREIGETIVIATSESGGVIFNPNSIRLPDATKANLAPRIIVTDYVIALQFAPIIPGDFNGDLIVDAADYSVWRDTLGSTTSLAADANANLVVDADDYAMWTANFGATYTPPPPEPTGATVPEPVAVLQIIAPALTWIAARGCRGFT